MSSQIFRSDLLTGQVALITGGGTGIGAYIAAELGRLGATIVIASRKADRIAASAEKLSGLLGAEVTGIACDIRDRDSTAALVAAVIQKHGRIDLLVNNGGGQFMSPAELITPRGWDAVVGTNLTGTWNLTRAVADGWMLGNGGRIVNITMLTRRGFPGMVHSVAARSGVEAMTRTLAIEWASYGIQINCVQPGVIASGGLRNYPDGENLARSIQAEIPMKRLGTCNEVAWMVAFLASPAGGYITGQVMTVDGGRELWGNTWPVSEPAELPEVDLGSLPWEE
ncbi:MAG: citronellol/citronellal dehydrogenase [Myxococcota bacterium]|jgi:citronellol/citronellal dehydrogenase